MSEPTGSTTPAYGETTAADPYGSAAGYGDPAPSNTIAIVGFVLAFLFWPAGLVCSILGLNKSKTMGGKGRGLAIAGIIISVVAAIVGILLVVSVFAVAGSSGSY